MKLPTVTPARVAVAVAVASVAAIAAGIGWIYPPAGLIAAGVLGLPGAYVIAYLSARRTR